MRLPVCFFGIFIFFLPLVSAVADSEPMATKELLTSYIEKGEREKAIEAYRALFGADQKTAETEVLTLTLMHKGGRKLDIRPPQTTPTGFGQGSSKEDYLKEMDKHLDAGDIDAATKAYFNAHSSERSLTVIEARKAVMEIAKSRK